MKIRLFHYTPEMVDCHYCTQYARKPPYCNLPGCPWLAERIEAGVVGYREAVTECFNGKGQLLQKRLRSLIDSFPNTMWPNHEHWERMEYLKAVLHFYRKRNTPKWYAVLYLASSNADLYSRMINCFTKNSIQFEKAKVRGISLPDYALLMTARTIYTGEGKITAEDLADKEIIDDETFRLIIHAILIAKYGLPVLKITAKSSIEQQSRKKRHMEIKTIP